MSSRRRALKAAKKQELLASASASDLEKENANDANKDSIKEETSDTKALNYLKRFYYFLFQLKNLNLGNSSAISGYN
jgi:hypothetical protein